MKRTPGEFNVDFVGKIDWLCEKWSVYVLWDLEAFEEKLKSCEFIYMKRENVPTSV